MNTSIASKAIQNKISKMEPDLQEAFYQEYNKRSKSKTLALILAISGIHYLYFKKWFLLILFLGTGGGFFIWWLIDIFRVGSLTDQYNQSAAIDTMREIEALR